MTKLSKYMGKLKNGKHFTEVIEYITAYMAKCQFNCIYKLYKLK